VEKYMLCFDCALLSFIDFHFVVCADEYSVCNVSSAYLMLNHMVDLYVDS